MGQKHTHTRVRDYDAPGEYTGGTDTHLAVDDAIRNESNTALEEGFAAASGVRNETAETGGRIKHPETKDEEYTKRDTHQAPNPVDEENAGLADN